MATERIEIFKDGRLIGVEEVNVPDPVPTRGVITLAAGMATVNTSAVTPNSMIQLTSQVDSGTPGFLRVASRVPGVSFSITSSSALDTSSVAWVLVEP